MARVVVLGAGISGHTAASFLRKWLEKNDYVVVVVSPLSHHDCIPSNICWSSSIGATGVTSDAFWHTLACGFKLLDSEICP
jgi:glycine/D-amino acid oxidase-like deaminating enzyme